LGKSGFIGDFHYKSTYRGTLSPGNDKLEEDFADFRPCCPLTLDANSVAEQRCVMGEAKHVGASV
jgi:hypothetical protein